MEIEKNYNGKLPLDYLSFLKENLNGNEIAFKNEDPVFEHFWKLMGEKELLKSWEMNGVGTARNFECLKLYVQMQQEYGTSEFTSNFGKIELNRVASGFVIGKENGDYLYLDQSDNFSVWIYYHDGGDVLRIADSFKEIL